jgi:hypothetical protein
MVTPGAKESAQQRQESDRLTQIGRGLGELGIGWIPAYSPQAKGRVERSFGTDFSPTRDLLVSRRPGGVWQLLGGNAEPSKAGTFWDVRPKFPVSKGLTPGTAGITHDRLISSRSPAPRLVETPREGAEQGGRDPRTGDGSHDGIKYPAAYDTPRSEPSPDSGTIPR